VKGKSPSDATGSRLKHMAVFHRLRLIVQFGPCVFTAFLLAGCASNTGSPREQFLRSVRADRSQYVQVYETSIEALKEREDEMLKAIRIAVRGTREEMKESGVNSNALDQRLARIEHVAAELHRARCAVIEELKQHYDPKLDIILFYEFRSESRRETAWVVMRGRNARWKMVLSESDLSRK
jgi:undecaprenyl pyrophosphate synthase